MGNRSKKEFIDEEIWVLTFGGGFQRAKIYSDSATNLQKNELRSYVKSYVRKLISSSYSVKCPSSTSHSKVISKFSADISAKFKDVLWEGRFKIGVAQKILNLYLKYLWCFGSIPVPPHCPFDRIIITKLGLTTSWTKLDDINQYNSLVSIAKSKAGQRSLAEWELEIFSRR